VMPKGFFKVFNNLSNFRSEGSFEGWIRKIMVREAIDFLRVQKQMNFSEEIEKEINASSSNTFQSNEEVDFLQQKIDELPEGYKAVFMLYAVEGYKHQEIAKMLNISEGTSKSQLSKARKLLQEKVKPTLKNGYAGE